MDRATRRKSVRKVQHVSREGAGDLQQQQPTPQEIPMEEPAVPDLNPAPAKSTSRPGRKVKQKLHHLQSDMVMEQPRDSTYQYRRTDEQLREMEQPGAASFTELESRYEWLEDIQPPATGAREYRGREGRQENIGRPGATSAGRHGDRLREPRATSAREHQGRQERSDRVKHPRSTSAREHGSRLERLLDEIIQSGRLRDREDSHSGHNISPTAVSHKGLQDISDSSEEGMEGLTGSESEQEVEPPSPIEGKKNNLLDMVGQYFQQEQTGKNLEDRMAASIEYMSTHQLQANTFAEVLARHLPPGNCAALNVASVNRCIWKHVGAGIRSQDLKVQNALKGLTAGITALARTLEKVDMTSDHKDALALFCNVQFELNNIRKGAIQPALDPKFAILCKQRAIKPQTLLFGGDLSKQVKDLDEEAKTLGLIRAAKGYLGKRYQPYGIPKKGGFYNSTKNWREARGPQQQRPFLGFGPGRPLWKMRKPVLQQLSQPQPQGPPQPRMKMRK
ncbi:uncharacterized protein LOC129696901 [Leucoraja erinacea]|uniref:uncharacterized protein LOC129696901 n=1 Tax=Leucoraja erinaceus TaxID=7782 RepID=UPI00245556C1|nr:uncharacterized protein LOC129696901 [Leucoraja erinacea]